MGVFLHHLVQGLIAHHVAPQVKQIVKIFFGTAPPGGGLFFCSVHSAALRKCRAAARRRQRQFL